MPPRARPPSRPAGPTPVESITDRRPIARPPTRPVHRTARDAPQPGGRPDRPRKHPYAALSHLARYVPTTLWSRLSGGPCSGRVDGHRKLNRSRPNRGSSISAADKVEAHLVVTDVAL